jgi:hypothetical protein
MHTILQHVLLQSCRIKLVVEGHAVHKDLGSSVERNDVASNASSLPLRPVRQHDSRVQLHAPMRNAFTKRITRVEPV